MVPSFVKLWAKMFIRGKPYSFQIKNLVTLWNKRLSLPYVNLSTWIARKFSTTSQKLAHKRSRFKIFCVKSAPKHYGLYFDSFFLQLHVSARIERKGSFGHRYHQGIPYLLGCLVDECSKEENQLQSVRLSMWWKSFDVQKVQQCYCLPRSNHVDVAPLKNFRRRVHCAPNQSVSQPQLIYAYSHKVKSVTYWISCLLPIDQWSGAHRFFPLFKNIENLILQAWGFIVSFIFKKKHLDYRYEVHLCLIKGPAGNAANNYMMARTTDSYTVQCSRKKAWKYVAAPLQSLPLSLPTSLPKCTVWLHRYKGNECCIS